MFLLSEYRNSVHCLRKRSSQDWGQSVFHVEAPPWIPPNIADTVNTPSMYIQYYSSTTVTSQSLEYTSNTIHIHLWKHDANQLNYSHNLKTWMMLNFLLLNSHKRKFFLLYAALKTSETWCPTRSLLWMVLPLPPAALWGVLESLMSLSAHIRQICRTFLFHICNINKIKNIVLIY